MGIKYSWWLWFTKRNLEFRQLNFLIPRVSTDIYIQYYLILNTGTAKCNETFRNESVQFLYLICTFVLCSDTWNFWGFSSNKYLDYTLRKSWKGSKQWSIGMDCPDKWSDLIHKRFLRTNWINISRITAIFKIGSKLNGFLRTFSSILNTVIGMVIIDSLDKFSLLQSFRIWIRQSLSFLVFALLGLLWHKEMDFESSRAVH